MPGVQELIRNLDPSGSSSNKGKTTRSRQEEEQSYENQFALFVKDKQQERRRSSSVAKEIHILNVENILNRPASFYDRNVGDDSEDDDVREFSSGPLCESPSLSPKNSGELSSRGSVAAAYLDHIKMRSSESLASDASESDPMVSSELGSPRRRRNLLPAVRELCPAEALRQSIEALRKPQGRETLPESKVATAAQRAITTSPRGREVQKAAPNQIRLPTNSTAVGTGSSIAPTKSCPALHNSGPTSRQKNPEAESIVSARRGMFDPAVKQKVELNSSLVSKSVDFAVTRQGSSLEDLSKFSPSVRGNPAKRVVVKLTVSRDSSNLAIERSKTAEFPRVNSLEKQQYEQMSNRARLDSAYAKMNVTDQDGEPNLKSPPSKHGGLSFDGISEDYSQVNPATSKRDSRSSQGWKALNYDRRDTRVIYPKRQLPIHGIIARPSRTEIEGKPKLPEYIVMTSGSTRATLSPDFGRSGSLLSLGKSDSRGEEGFFQSYDDQVSGPLKSQRELAISAKLKLLRAAEPFYEQQRSLMFPASS